MQAKPRKEVDADLIPDEVGISDIKTEQYSHEINCESCNRVFYSDEAHWDSINRKMELGLENNFLCPQYIQDLDTLAYEQR